MSGPPDDTRQLHDTMDFIGLRAHATAAGLLQLCSELVSAGIIDLQAIERIKAAIHREILVSHGRGRGREEFAQTLKGRLDSIFPNGKEGQRASPVGSVEDMQSALDRS